MIDKAHMRERYRRERREAFVPAVYSNVLATPEVTQATIVASYVSYAHEPSTVELNRALIKSLVATCKQRSHRLDLLGR